MNGEFIDALEQLQREKDIPMDALIETVEAAMASAYRKKYGVNEDIRLEIDFEGRGVTMYARRLVEPIGTVTATAEETEVATATPEGEAAVATGVTYEEHEVDPAEFTRIAAQTFKQVVMQRVREAEREIMFDEFSHRVGEVITGEVQRKDARNVIVTVSRTDALLPAHEQIPGETFRFGDQLKFYVLDVQPADRAVAPAPRPGRQAVRDGGPGGRRRHRRAEVRGARGGRPVEGRRTLARPQGGPGRRLCGSPRSAGASDRGRTARRED